MTTEEPRGEVPALEGRSSGEARSAGAVGEVVLEGQLFRKTVTYAEVDGLAVFEGDIVLGTIDEVRDAGVVELGLTAADINRPRVALNFASDAMTAEGIGIVDADPAIAGGVAISGHQYRWPEAVIPYDIDPHLEATERVTDAIAHWEALTSVRFVLRTQENAGAYRDFVRFMPGAGCASRVGRLGIGMQEIWLGSACSTGNCVHEIGHTVGLWHEHSREDRDTYVTIHEQNILDDQEHNFLQHIADGDDLGPYDYASIMHYPADAFTKNGGPTITPVIKGAQIGQRKALSANDVLSVKQMYP